jgi:flagellum-specific ATP synthase
VQSYGTFYTISEQFEAAIRPKIIGRVSGVSGLIVEGPAPGAAIGDRFDVVNRLGRSVPAEVVGLRGRTALLMALGTLGGVGVGCDLVPRPGRETYPCSDALLGRVLDGLGQPLDGRSLELGGTPCPIHGKPPQALGRKPVEERLEMGIRCIDGLNSIGRGQRLGIFAGAGVGKSTLLGMILRHAETDVCVLALVGERGREVGDFIRKTLGAEGLARTVMVVATSDQPPLVRVRAALLATTIAEYFRGRGKHALLVMDSLTRYCLALREIGLSAGEPPATRGFPPSVFAALPQLLERAGNDSGSGSLTAIYSVLVEGDDMTEPVADAVKAILDGHLVLSRDQANRGIYPAVDPLASISRVMPDVTDPRHLAAARAVRDALAAYREAEDLLSIGAYSPGSNPRVDAALQVLPDIEDLIRQPLDDHPPEGSTIQRLIEIATNYVTLIQQTTEDATGGAR